VGCAFGFVHHRLHGVEGALRDYRKVQNTAGGTVYCRDEIDPTFFEPTKVYNSSNSTVSVVAGTGSVGVFSFSLIW